MAEQFADERATKDELTVARKNAEVERSSLEPEAPYPNASLAAWFAASNAAPHAAKVAAEVAADRAGYFACRFYRDGITDDDDALLGKWNETIRAAYEKRVAAIDAQIAIAQGEQAMILRDIIGNPFSPLPPKKGKKMWEKELRSWVESNNAAVAHLAQTIYDDRAFALFPILGDALEEAGCTDTDILNHCRQPGEHVRGCWVLDLILSKDR